MTIDAVFCAGGLESQVSAVYSTKKMTNVKYRTLKRRGLSYLCQLDGLNLRSVLDFIFVHSQCWFAIYVVLFPIHIAYL